MMAIEVKKNSKKVNEELEKVRKETYGEKVHEVETYKKIKERVDNELTQNEIININKKLDDMYNRFNSSDIHVCLICMYDLFIYIHTYQTYMQFMIHTSYIRQQIQPRRITDHTKRINTHMHEDTITTHTHAHIQHR